MIRNSLKIIQEEVEYMLEENLFENSRRIDVVVARHIFFGLARRHTNMTFKRIGMYLDKDHATVMHGIKKLESHFLYDKDLLYKYNELNENVRRRLTERLDNQSLEEHTKDITDRNEEYRIKNRDIIFDLNYKVEQLEIDNKEKSRVIDLLLKEKSKLTKQLKDL